MHCLITQNLILSLVHQPHQRSKISLLLWSRKLHTFLDLDMVIQPTTVPIPVHTTCTDMIATFGATSVLFLERKWDTINTCTHQRTLPAQLTVVGSKLYVALGPYKRVLYMGITFWVCNLYKQFWIYQLVSKIFFPLVKMN